MPPKIDETGKRYGRLRVIKEAGKYAQGWISWECACACGGKVVVCGAFLRNGNTTSCGCYHREVSSKVHTTHGLSASRGMKAIYQATRRAKERDAQGSHTPQDIDRIYRRQNGLCFYCFAPLNVDFHRDHKIPLSRGGTNYARNIALACGSCNRKKQTKTASEFKKLLGEDNGGETR